MHTRTTHDYSPLRGPINDDRGRDISGRTRKERQDYEAAVNARKEMLKVFDGIQPRHKKKCRKYSDWHKSSKWASKAV